MGGIYIYIHTYAYYILKLYIIYHPPMYTIPKWWVYHGNCHFWRKHACDLLDFRAYDGASLPRYSSKRFLRMTSRRMRPWSLEVPVLYGSPLKRQEQFSAWLMERWQGKDERIARHPGSVLWASWIFWELKQLNREIALKVSWTLANQDFSWWNYSPDICSSTRIIDSHVRCPLH